MTPVAPLPDFLPENPLDNDDLLATVLPLLQEVQEAHEAALVAPLRGLTHLTAGESGLLSLSTDCIPPRLNPSRIRELQPQSKGGITVLGRYERETDLSTGDTGVRSLDVTDGEITRPIYVPGYTCWELEIGHHDALADIAVLGLLLASLATGLDFNGRAELEDFALARDNLFRLNPRLHPVIARVIVEMTELDRHRRTQDLAPIVRTLANYRDIPADQELDFVRDAAFKTGAAPQRRRLIQTRLRDRLFDISRRNRLLYFKPSLQTLNLTVSSVPLMLDYRNIRPNQLFFWQPEIAGAISNGASINLGKHLRFEEAPYLRGVLDKIISEARRDRAEYGFAQLRLVPCFLQWHNLKEAANERITSPLLLLPVELTKRKGVRDSYVLEPVSTEAEVNPVLRHHLRDLYDLQLPETVDLRQTTLEQFHAELAAKIHASEPGVTLRLQDKPRIRLIHERARQRLDTWRRRNNSRGAVALKTDYSYSADDLRPKGLRLFHDKIKPTPSPVRYLADATPSGAVEPVNAVAVEREMFALAEEAGNPYTWDFDLCSVTLGNFHYRKMTLVRDYAALLEDDKQSAAFDSVFSVQPKPRPEKLDALPLEERYTVVTGDATQISALAQARAGDSYTIQGPPGTGKSQTITNLIADYVARGKRVLFVCEKRAAIDVVFHRLGQQNLQELCCLIHDSQTDKKAFVLNLKTTYEGWLNLPDDGSAESQRAALLSSLGRELAVLERFSAGMSAADPRAALHFHQLLRRSIELGPGTQDPAVQERLPFYATWQDHRDLLRRLELALSDVAHVKTLAEHPLRYLSSTILEADRPLETLKHQIDNLEQLSERIETALELSGLPAESWDTLEEVERLLHFAASVAPLAEIDQLGLLLTRTEASRALREAAESIDKLRKTLAKAEKSTKHWKDKLAPEETRAALTQAKSLEGSFFRWLNPSFYRLRALIQTHYDFAAHKVSPTLVDVLNQLEAEHAAREAVEEAESTAAAKYRVPDFAEFEEQVAAWRTAPERKDPAVEALARTFAESEAGRDTALALRDIARELPELDATLSALLGNYGRLDFPALNRELEAIRSRAADLPGLLLVLREVAAAPAELRSALQEVPLTGAAFEAASAYHTVQTRFREDRDFARLDGPSVDRARDEVTRGQKSLLALNSATVRERVQTRFRDNIALSNAPAAGLAPHQKEFKRAYNAGRRELEHEFGKTMRYKSIRDLVDGESGRVVRDLKPVWLMSPLSVSDTLPLQSDLFDVVIFDEASQIPVEEAVPALYRAAQVIVVGDEMQLPPTAFFASSREGEDSVEIEEDGERIEVGLDADSLLTQSGANLPSTMLAWHYRSRYEALISFSNAAFYRGELFTIPDRQLPPPGRPQLTVNAEVDIPSHVTATLERSISFHFMAKSPYESRRNAGEAAYIAELVRELLARQTGMTIGIVAFSEAQQGEIERALDSLADQSPQFAAQLAEEEIREEDDQFCGLFVKNLENVQGDERDIIILSVCYGPDANGKTLMNFGPINQRGGEKRLNVIFSRARHHMAVVSSLRHTAITNDYNDGAAALKNYLQFAACVSTGDLETARRVLDSQNPTRARAAAKAVSDATVAQLAAALRARDHEVDSDVGQSRFRCDLALRGPEGTYRLGILVDTETHYANPDVLERYCTRPAILEAFGWPTTLVLSKDWLENRDAVLARIDRILNGKQPSSPEPVAVTILEHENIEKSPVKGGANEGKVGSEGGPTGVEGGSEGGPKGVEKELLTAVAPAHRRYLELVSGTSAKFWEVTVTGETFTIRFGRIGTKGQSLTKTYPDPAAAQAEADRLANDKIKKGYVEK